ncbi:MAG: methyltransferase domain-containing protein [Pseudomonadota bacterium]
MPTLPDNSSMPQVGAHDPVLRWAGSARGRRLLSIEHQEVSRQLPELFGRHFLQIGHWGLGNDWLEGSEMLHRAVLTTSATAEGQARVDALALPLASHSVDAMLLPHTLELAISPHALLREVSRVLSERGRLLILGFNPWSLLGMRRWFGLAPRMLPTDTHFYSTGRVCDWLTLLDFEITAVRRFGAGFPWLPPRGSAEFFSPAAMLQPLSEGYLIVAKKRVATMTLVGRTQRAQVRQLVPVPAANAVHRDGEPENPAN